MAANANPESFQAALSQILMQGVADGEATDAETTMKANELFAKQQLDQQRSALELQKLQTQAEAKRAKVVMGVAKQGQQAKLAFQQAQQKEKEKAAAKQMSPQEVVDSTLAGTETRTFRPAAPMSANRPDTAGADVNQVLQAALGGRMAQAVGPTGGGGVQPESPGGRPAAPQQQQLPQGGGFNPLQARMGGQTYNAPEELVRRVNALGAEPVRTQGGFAMAPTFSQQTIREPNALTAGQVADINMRQQQLTLATAVELWQDAEGAPLDKVLSGVQRQFQEGDPSQLLELGRQYPSLSRKAAAADIAYKQDLSRAARAAATESAARTGLTNEQAAWLRLQRTGADSASDLGAWLFGPTGSVVGGGVGVTASGKPKAGGAAATSPYGKLELKDVYNEKEGTWDDNALLHFTRTEAARGRLYYKDEGGTAIGGFGRAKGALSSVSIPKLSSAIVVAVRGDNEAQRQAAQEWLDSMPFMNVEPPARPGDAPRISWENDQSPASEVGRILVERLSDHLGSGAPIPNFVMDELALQRLLAIEQPAPAPAATPADRPFKLKSTQTLAPGAPITPGAGRTRVKEAFGEVTGAIEDYRTNARPGEGMAVYFARKRREARQAK